MPLDQLGGKIESRLLFSFGEIAKLCEHLFFNHDYSHSFLLLAANNSYRILFTFENVEYYAIVQ